MIRYIPKKDELEELIKKVEDLSAKLDLGDAERNDDNKHYTNLLLLLNGSKARVRCRYLEGYYSERYTKKEYFSQSIYNWFSIEVGSANLTVHYNFVSSSVEIIGGREAMSFKSDEEAEVYILKWVMEHGG